MNFVYLLLIVIFVFLCVHKFGIEYYSNVHTISKIHTHIYLSSYKIANNKKLLKKYNIKNILTIMPDCYDCDKMKKYNGIDYLQISKNDHKDENLKDDFDKCFKFIDNAIDKKENILIHCRAGKSRSPTIIAAYLIKKYNMTRDEALKYMKQHRKIINPNSGFMKQLKEYENEIKNE
jgi:protein-tyrosine phosphatase